MKKFKRPLAITAASIMALSLSACFHSDDDEDDPVVATYKVTVSNLTNHQPMTPVAVVVHKDGYNGWAFGEAASTGLEKLAEGGITTDFISEASANANVVTTDVAGAEPFGPGGSVTVSVMANHSADLEMSVASMLANTNDAFTGLDAVTIGELAVGESMIMMGHVFDAGTEANTETDDTIAGPAGDAAIDGGYSDGARDDAQNFVRIHSGVVTSDDGLSTSALNESHRWNGVAAKVVIERM